MFGVSILKALSRRGRAEARETQDAFSRTVADVRSVGSESIEQLRQQLRDIQQEVHVRESSIPSIPPHHVAEVDLHFDEVEPDTSPEIKQSAQQRRQAAPRPAPRPPPIPREEPDVDPGDSGGFAQSHAIPTRPRR